MLIVPMALQCPVEAFIEVGTGVTVATLIVFLKRSSLEKKCWYVQHSTAHIRS